MTWKPLVVASKSSRLTLTVEAFVTIGLHPWTQEEDAVASAWIETYKGKRGVRYRVNYRLGGRESRPHRAGTFGTKRDANARKAWVAGELAAMRVPDLRLMNPMPSPTFRTWRKGGAHHVSTSRAAPPRPPRQPRAHHPGDRHAALDSILPDEIAALVVTISGLKA